METHEARVTTRSHRRLAIGTAGVAAGLLLFGSVAWACTQRVGTLLVCRPPASTYVSSAQCGKITSTVQTGSPTAYKAGSQFSVKGTNFYAKNYRVTFRNPGSTSSCHVPGGAVSVLTSVTPKIADSLPAGTTQLTGPSFQAEYKSPALATTGQAKVCVQDVPDRVTGQIINMSVI